MVDVTGAVGLVATLTSISVFIPQALQTYRQRHDPQALRGVSLASQVVLIANAVMWMMYAWLTEAYFSGAPSLFYIPLALFIIVLLLRFRGSGGGSPTPSRDASERKSCACCGGTGLEYGPGGSQHCGCVTSGSTSAA